MILRAYLAIHSLSSLWNIYLVLLGLIALTTTSPPRCEDKMLKPENPTARVKLMMLNFDIFRSLVIVRLVNLGRVLSRHHPSHIELATCRTTR